MDRAGSAGRTPARHAPDTMPQAIKLTDAAGRSCIYVPITQNDKVVDSQGLCSIWRMSEAIPPRTTSTKMAPGGHFSILIVPVMVALDDHHLVMATALAAIPSAM